MGADGVGELMDTEAAIDEEFENSAAPGLRAVDFARYLHCLVTIMTIRCQLVGNTQAKISTF